jgi:hypothetical protein
MTHEDSADTPHDPTTDSDEELFSRLKARTDDEAVERICELVLHSDDNRDATS